MPGFYSQNHFLFLNQTKKNWAISFHIQNLHQKVSCAKSQFSTEYRKWNRDRCRFLRVTWLKVELWLYGGNWFIVQRHPLTATLDRCVIHYPAIPCFDYTIYPAVIMWYITMTGMFALSYDWIGDYFRAINSVSNRVYILSFTVTDSSDRFEERDCSGNGFA